MQSDSKSVPSITDLLGKEILFFDGGTGSVLQAQGLKPGELPETWNLIHPDRITGLHYEYFRAGCNIIKTNTFGANCLKFPCRGTQSSPAAGISVPVPDEPGNINCTNHNTSSTATSGNTGGGCPEKTPDGTAQNVGGCSCSIAAKSGPGTNTAAHRDNVCAVPESPFPADAGVPDAGTTPQNEIFYLEDIISAAIKNAGSARHRIETETIPAGTMEQLRQNSLIPRTREPAVQPHFIALDVGPCGKLLEPLGDLSFEAAVSVFSATIRAALTGTAEKQYAGTEKSPENPQPVLEPSETALPENRLPEAALFAPAAAPDTGFRTGTVRGTPNSPGDGSDSDSSSSPSGSDGSNSPGNHNSTGDGNHRSSSDNSNTPGNYSGSVAAGQSCRPVPVDLILIETMNDCYEAKAAVIAAKEVMAETGITLPVVVTTVYDETGKSLTGSGAQTMAAILEGLGVSALGMNCSLGPRQMQPLVPLLAESTGVPLAVNPNAGLPRSENGKTVYDVSPEEFAQITGTFVDAGASLIGGCCGTTPEHICRLVDMCAGKPCPVPAGSSAGTVTSGTKSVQLGGKPVLIGERINPTGKKRFKQALRDRDIPYIIREGLTQEEAGAHILDVNVGLPEINEPELLRTVVQELQTVTELPLQLDTSDPAAMEAAMRIYNGKPLINSVNGKQEVMEAVFPLVKKYGGAVVALTLDESGIPETAAGRIAIAEKIYRTAAGYGLSRQDIIIDPLAMTISSDTRAAKTTLETLKAIHDQYGGSTILGVSNISFGLPRRELITAAFFTMALQCGLSAAIMNPHSLEMMKAYTCFCTLSGYDANCMEYMDFVQRRETELSAEPAGNRLPGGTGTAPAGTDNSGSRAPVSADRTMPGIQTAAGTAGASGRTFAPDGDTPAVADPLEYAVIRGLKPEAAERTQQLLLTEQPLDIINGKLIPALDIVGKGFESKTLYLPQLLMSAEAAKAAFNVIKEHMSAAGTAGESKGTIVLATVKGDIHDIGKNIVKVLLENYRFTVIDLGKDVPPETVAAAVIEHRVQLAGLSALMTTTVPAMEATIRLLREQAPWCKVCVGGAVLTREYADMIGADFYAKDALETVKYAQQIFP